VGSSKDQGFGFGTLVAEDEWEPSPYVSKMSAVDQCYGLDSAASIASTSKTKTVDESCQELDDSGIAEDLRIEVDVSMEDRNEDPDILVITVSDNEILKSPKKGAYCHVCYDYGHKGMDCEYRRAEDRNSEHVKSLIQQNKLRRKEEHPEIFKREKDRRNLKAKIKTRNQWRR